MTEWIQDSQESKYCLRTEETFFVLDLTIYHDQNGIVKKNKRLPMYVSVGRVKTTILLKYRGLQGN